MTGLVRQTRTFSRPIQILLINQVGINVGFYMLMPYLATYLTGHLGIAAWMAGLILGLRNFSQQGMFLLGGTLADRLGYKPVIVTGCALRVVGFGLFGVAGGIGRRRSSHRIRGRAVQPGRPRVRGARGRGAPRRDRTGCSWASP
jgi:MFS family permease